MKKLISGVYVTRRNVDECRSNLRRDRVKVSRKCGLTQNRSLSGLEIGREVYGS